MKMNMTITNPRRSRRELAEQWSQYRSGVKLCIKQGLYEAAAVLRGQLNLTARVWGHYKAGRL